MKEKLFRYWKDRELNEPDFWKEHGEYNLLDMVEMAAENFTDIGEETIEQYAIEYVDNQ